MKKSIKTLINILIFILIGGFVCYMIRSVSKESMSTKQSQTIEKDNFVSPYRLFSSFDVGDKIRTFDLYEEKIYLSARDSIFVFDLSGIQCGNFAINAYVRDITVKDNRIFVLYPTNIEVYTLLGEKLNEWESCSKSDYCSITLSKDYVFVTDALNKNICQYTRDGNFIKFIKSPNEFIIPSYSFDILNINDTLYCINSGRHSIESYTLNGDFIASFGKSGEEAGSFSGCCNPAYLAQTSRGNILTSEKGNPRISCYDRNGKFRTIILNNKLLGGGNSAYKVQVMDDYVFTSGNNKIYIFIFDPDSVNNSACIGCTADCSTNCPMKKL